MSIISPIDSRYASLSQDLSTIFSEEAFVIYRLRLEIKYFKFLSTVIPDLPNYKNIQVKLLNNTFKRFKELEEKTNHDVKAIEYLTQETLINSGIDPKDITFIHFGLTSQDINDPALAHSIQDGVKTLDNNLQLLINSFINFPLTWWNIPMLSHTHGQPGVPTTMGKELMVFCHRLDIQRNNLQSIKLRTKFGGAVGNLNAHYAAYPNIDWKTHFNNFISSINLIRNEYTTQVDHYDSIAEVLDCIKRINTILLDFALDIWLYTHKEYFKLKVKKTETGSSTMPHKVNPIDFENAEGNLKLANSILNTIATELPRSRLQRDLSGSTLSRNIGTAFAYTLIAIKKLVVGCSKLDINEQKLSKDLECNTAVITEGIQTILRKHKYQGAYEKLKDFSRGKELDMEIIKTFITNLDTNPTIKEELLNLCNNYPQSYLGTLAKL